MSHEDHMWQAIEEAGLAGEKGNRAVGAVIVRDGQVIGRGGNRRESGVDPAGHAETSALRDAVANTGSLDFSGCVLYSTLEPCPMCGGAIAVNGVPHVVIGRLHTPEERRWGDYAVTKLLSLVDQGTLVETGVLQEACEAVLHEWDVKQGRTTA